MDTVPTRRTLLRRRRRRKSPKRSSVSSSTAPPNPGPNRSQSRSLPRRRRAHSSSPRRPRPPPTQSLSRALSKATELTTANSSDLARIRSVLQETDSESKAMRRILRQSTLRLRHFHHLTQSLFHQISSVGPTSARECESVVSGVESVLRESEQAQRSFNKTSECEELRNQLLESQKRERKLRRQAVEWQHHIAVERNHVKERERDLDVLRVHVRTQVQRTETLKKEKELAERRLGRVTELLKDTKVELKSVLTSNAAYQQMLQSNIVSLEGVVHQIETDKAVFKRSQRRIGELARQLQQHEETSRALKKSIQTQIELLKAKELELEQEKAGKRSLEQRTGEKIQDLNRAISVLKRRLARGEEEVRKRDHLLDQEKERCRQLKNVMSQVDESHRRKIAEKESEVAASILKMKKLADRHRAEYEKLGEERNRLILQVAELSERAETSEKHPESDGLKTHSGPTAAMSSLKMLLPDSLARELRGLEEDLTQTEEDSARLQEELRAKNEEAMEAKNEIDSRDDEIHRLKKICDRQSFRIDELQTEIVSISSKVVRMQARSDLGLAQEDENVGNLTNESVCEDTPRSPKIAVTGVLNTEKTAGIEKLAKTHENSQTDEEKIARVTRELESLRTEGKSRIRRGAIPLLELREGLPEQGTPEANTTVSQLLLSVEDVSEEILEKMHLTKAFRESLTGPCDGESESPMKNHQDFEEEDDQRSLQLDGLDLAFGWTSGSLPSEKALLTSQFEEILAETKEEGG